jgi:anti-sigma B factor antagonist
LSEGKVSIVHSTDFGFEVADLEGVTVIKLSGELDVAIAPQLRASLLEISDSVGRDVVVDVGDVGYLDSSGISVLVMSCKRVRSQGGTFTVRNASGSVRRVFEITGLIDYFHSDRLAISHRRSSSQREPRPTPGGS